MIKVSVIVPVYKVPLEYLRACLDSLTAQTMQECEFILVSDGAPEAECSVCEEFSAKDSRFKFFRREHSGVSATRNYGIEYAQGEFLTFVDSDDWIAKDSCDIAYNYAKCNNSDIVLWEAAQDLNGCQKYGFFSSTPINILSEKQIDSIISNIIYTTAKKYYSASLVCCKLFKKNLIIQNNIRYPESLIMSEDRIFNISAYKHSKKISYLNSIMYFYRIHNQSASHRYIPHAFEQYSAFIKLLDKDTRKKNINAINNEIVRSFFLSWQTYYLHNENKASFKSKVNEIKDVIKTYFFQQALKKKFHEFPQIIQIEIFCFKHNIFFPIYIHSLKALLKKHIIRDQST